MTISDQLTLKYGKPLAEAARANQLEYPAKVNPRLIQKLGVSTPPKLLVEKYLILIAKSAGVDFMPDPDAMRDDEVSLAEKMLIDFKTAGEAPNPVPTADPYNEWQLGEGAYLGQRGVISPAGAAPIYQTPPVTAALSSALPDFLPNNHAVPGGPRFPLENNGAGGGIYEVSGAAPQNYFQDYTTLHRKDFDNPNVAGQPSGFHLPWIGFNGIPVELHVNYPTLRPRNSLITNGQNAEGPSAPPQSLKKPDNLDSEIQFPDPSGNLSTLPCNCLDFDDIARRFDQLKKKP